MQKTRLNAIDTLAASKTGYRFSVRAQKNAGKRKAVDPAFRKAGVEP